MEAGLQEETKVQVRFAAKTGGQDAVDLNIPDTAFAVPDRLTRKGLAEVINGLLSLDPPQRFDFLVNGELLRSSLSTFLTNRNVSALCVLIKHCASSMVVNGAASLACSFRKS